MSGESSSYTRFGGRLIRKSFHERLFSRHQNEASRIVYVDNRLLPCDEVVHFPNYPDNTVVSSKYTLLTFLPKNLLEQLQRIANFYFLCIACIQFFIETPVTPLTSILPLGFVISVTAIKQGYEDWLRHKADKEVNLRQTLIIRNGVQEAARAMDIKVGDIVKVQRNEEFPCDLVLLSSEDPLGQCYVTTANLDGETNLKTLYCLSETRTFNTPEKLGHLTARIRCLPPVADLYKFEGVMEHGTEVESKPLGPDNLLLRGARLKNTEYIYGCAVYTGQDTKMTLNYKSKKIKFSRVERKMNKFLLVILLVLLAESVISTGLMYWFEGTYGVPWYVPKEKTKAEVLKALEHALAFMVLYNYIIPISLYVTVEMQKFLGSLFFGLDIEMYDATINEPALANTSDLNEELGQIEYLFTDKTGTLTENTMIFQRCCIGSRQFEMVDGKFCEKWSSDSSLDIETNVHFTEDMDEFFRVLVLCHSVRLDSHVRCSMETPSLYSTTGREYEYHSSSPDEKALVTACCKLGIIYHGTNDNVLEVSFHGWRRRFKLLHTLPFDPTRKRMSVIIEDEHGHHILLCKGAEISMLDRIVEGDVHKTQNLINEYAMLGLRTLTIAQRKLTPEEYKECDKMLTEAKKSLGSREMMLAEAYNEIEQKLTLLGATAVEDKLQDQVPQTIEALRMAGIKVWVLTGDKEETAVNISHAAGHFSTDMHELRLTHITTSEYCEPQLQELLLQTSTLDQKMDYALIIDGQSLAFAIKHHEKMLYQLCSRCVAVLCCRMSPLQKAQVVAMIKHSPGRPVTAAIGDGANDVSMIQEADVGLGIMGKEGRQAVRNSDYAFGKFKFLRRALLLHGHLYYNRIAVLVQYFFYKNVAWITAQVIYAIFSSFSQQSLFDPFYLMFYNLTFTSLPILIYGLFEQHIPKHELLNNPELYRKISRNSTLSWLQFLKWNTLGLWHCLVFFFGMYLLQMNGVSIFHSGVAIGNFDLGTLIMFTCVITVNLKLLLETYYWCLPTLIGYIITFGGIIVFSAIYTNIFFPSSMVASKDLYKSLAQVYSAAVTWLAMLLLIIAALLPDVVYKVIRDTNNSRCLYRNFKSRFSEIATTDRKESLMPISCGQIQLKKCSMIGSPVEIIELHSNISPSSASATQTGYDNPVLSLAEENLPSNGVANIYTEPNVLRLTVNGRSDATQKSDVIIEHPYGRSYSGEASVPQLGQDEGYMKNNPELENEPLFSKLHYQDSQTSADQNITELNEPLFHYQDDQICTDHHSSVSNGLLPSTYSSNSAPTVSVVSTIDVGIEDIEDTYKSPIHSPSHNGHSTYHEFSKSTACGSSFNNDNSSATVDFVTHTVQPHTNILPFSPSPSHAVPFHPRLTQSLDSIREQRNQNTHFSSESLPL